jgi:hypothetical protein
MDCMWNDNESHPQVGFLTGTRVLSISTMNELGVLWMDEDDDMSEQLARRLLALENDFADVALEERVAVEGEQPEEAEEEAGWPLSNEDYLQLYEDQLRHLRIGYDWQQREQEPRARAEDNELDLLLLEQEYLQHDPLDWDGDHEVWEPRDDSEGCGSSEDARFRELVRDAECEGCARRAALCFMWAWAQHGAAPLPRELAEMIGKMVLRSGFRDPQAWLRARKLTRALALVRQAGFDVF